MTRHLAFIYIYLWWRRPNPPSALRAGGSRKLVALSDVECVEGRGLQHIHDPQGTSYAAQGRPRGRPPTGRPTRPTAREKLLSRNRPLPSGTEPLRFCFIAMAAIAKNVNVKRMKICPSVIRYL